MPSSANKSTPQSSEPTITLTISELAAIVARAAATHGTPAVATTLAAAPPEGTPATPEYLTTRQAAELLGLSVKGLEAMRARGDGPRYIRVGHRVRYPASEFRGAAK